MSKKSEIKRIYNIVAPMVRETHNGYTELCLLNCVKAKSAQLGLVLDILDQNLSTLVGTYQHYSRVRQERNELRAQVDRLERQLEKAKHDAACYNDRATDRLELLRERDERQHEIGRRIRRVLNDGLVDVYQFVDDPEKLINLIPSRKIETIKYVRDQLGTSLKDSKEIVDAELALLKEQAAREEARRTEASKELTIMMSSPSSRNDEQTCENNSQSSRVFEPRVRVCTERVIPSS